MTTHTTDYLLIDISNSYTKFGFASVEKVLKTSRLRTRTLDLEQLREITAGWKYSMVVLSSVVPDRNALVMEFAAEQGVEVLRISPRLDLGVGIQYPEPEKIGEDRLANAAGAVARKGAPVVVVDFGTAVTFDIVDKQGNYLGGVIAPGLESMTDYLHQRTALLPKIAIEEPGSIIGKSTEQAMLAGAVYGYRGMVERILQEIHRELGEDIPLSILATGGYAELISRGVEGIEEVDPELTLDGLRVVANRYGKINV